MSNYNSNSKSALNNLFILNKADIHDIRQYGCAVGNIGGFDGLFTEVGLVAKEKPHAVASLVTLLLGAG